MTLRTVSELTILFLLLISSLRVFFIRNERKDSLSVVPLLALICSVLNILAWGVSLLDSAVFVLSLLVFIFNFHARLRLSEDLIIDRYSAMMVIGSTFSVAAAVLLAAVVLAYRPVKADFKKYGVQCERSYLTGSMTEGFATENDQIAKRSATVYRYIPAPDKSGAAKNVKGTIVFIPPQWTECAAYETFFVKLAHDGYSVYAADIYSDDTRPQKTLAFIKEMRRFSFAYNKLNDTPFYKEWVESRQAVLYTELYTALANAMPKGTEYIALGDSLPKDVYIALLGRKCGVSKAFDMANLAGYTTPGWGLLEQTDPFLAGALGFKRDASSYTSNVVAAELEKLLEK